MADKATFSFNTQWGCIFADEETTVEEIMRHGVPEESAKSLLAIAHAGVKRLNEKRDAKERGE